MWMKLFAVIGQVVALLRDQSTDKLIRWAEALLWYLNDIESISQVDIWYLN